MFHASFCKSLGIKLESGTKSNLGGIVGSASVPIYYHPVKIQIGADQLSTVVGFCTELSVAGILGRRGFFENFIVKIDSSTNPPNFEIEKIHKA
jgi:hypothetical protein